MKGEGFRVYGLGFSVAGSGGAVGAGRAEDERAGLGAYSSEFGFRV